MVSGELKELLRALQITQRILWFALTASIPMYIVVGYALVGAGAVGGAALPDAVRIGLLAAALVAGVLALVVPRRLLSDERLGERVAREPDLPSLATDTRAGGVDAGLLGRIQQLSPLEQRLFATATGSTVPLLAGLALSEAVAVIGLVLCLLFGDLGSLLALSVVALVINASLYPNVDRLLERASRLVRTY
ncbi:MAG: hypothetical protein JSU66_14590 [Deltaproteobacteria bacterium]|nr:MAG: hypothetical protein JSU66_14590 [Deltaproteobacteria bacterium]